MKSACDMFEKTFGAANMKWVSHVQTNNIKPFKDHGWMTFKVFKLGGQHIVTINWRGNCLVQMTELSFNAVMTWEDFKVWAEKNQTRRDVVELLKGWDNCWIKD